MDKVVIADADLTALADEVTLLLRQAADGPERSGLLRFRAWHWPDTASRLLSHAVIGLARWAPSLPNSRGGEGARHQTR
jgi:hypothetical protein